MPLLRRLSLALALLVPAVAVACMSDEDALGPVATPTQLSPFDVAIRVTPEDLTRGSAAFVSVFLRNSTGSTLAIESRDGCPVFEPVVRSTARPQALLPFAPGGCAAPTGTIDTERLEISVAPGDTVAFHFPFDGTILPVTIAGEEVSCLPAGTFEVLLLSPAAEAGTVAVATIGPRFPRTFAAFTALLREAPEGEGPPPCTA